MNKYGNGNGNSERVLHPAGLFAAVVIGHGIENSSRGTPTVVIRFKTDHAHITGWFALTDRAAEYTAQKVYAINPRLQSIADLADGQCCVGNPCVIEVKHQVYNGTMQDRVGFVHPEGYKPDIKSDVNAAASAKQFDALLRRLQQRDGVKPESPAPTIQSDDPTPRIGHDGANLDDGCPF